MSRLGDSVMFRILAILLVLPAVGLAQDKKGTKYAFLVAVSKYDEQNGLRPLPFAVRDVESFREALLLSGYEAKNIWLLHDRLREEHNPGYRFVPKKAEILKELGMLMRVMEEEDSLVVVLNGHGVHFKGDKTSHFCPLDADLGTKANMIPMDGNGGLYPLLEKCKARSKLLIAGMCRNDPKEFPADSQAAELIDLEVPDKPPQGIAAFYSCEPGQRTYFEPTQGSYFFKHLSAAWRGDYSGEDEVTLDAVFTNVRAKTKKDVFDMSKGTKDQFPEVRRKYDGSWVVQPPDLALVAREYRRYESTMNCELHLMSFADGYEKPHLNGVCRAPELADKPNREKRFGDLLRMAKQGNARAMLLTGNNLQYGDGVAKDEKQAAEWYHKAGDLGVAFAMFELGLMAKDKEQANEYHRKAAELGSPKAMCWMASVVLGDDPKNSEEALKWAVRGAEYGFYYALDDLASAAMFDEKGKPKDAKMALALFRRSAGLGSPTAMCMIGAAHLRGDGVEKDDRKAVEWFRKAADLGDANGMTCLGFCHEHGRGVEKSQTVAVEWFRKALKTDKFAEGAKDALKRLEK